MATDVLAPMQGRVIELILTSGDTVEEDDQVLMLEALKMEIPVVAPAGGVLVEYLVHVGDDVDVGTRLAVIGD